MIEKQFGSLLRSKRKDKKISQIELANRANLDRTYISLLERGLRQPTLIVLFRISEALEIPLSSIIKDLEILLDENC